MNGFELTYKGQVIAASLKNGSTSIFLSKNTNDNTLSLNFRGLDKEKNQDVVWFRASIIAENEKIRIKVVDVDKTAEIIESKPNRRCSPQQKLQEYESLKKYIEEEGWLEK